MKCNRTHSFLVVAYWSSIADFGLDHSSSLLPAILGRLYPEAGVVARPAHCFCQPSRPPATLFLPPSSGPVQAPSASAHGTVSVNSSLMPNAGVVVRTAIHHSDFTAVISDQLIPPPCLTMWHLAGGLHIYIAPLLPTTNLPTRKPHRQGTSLQVRQTTRLQHSSSRAQICGAFLSRYSFQRFFLQSNHGFTWHETQFQLQRGLVRTLHITLTRRQRRARRDPLSNPLPGD
jgi:hypothetical protein